MIDLCFWAENPARRRVAGKDIGKASYEELKRESKKCFRGCVDDALKALSTAGFVGSRGGSGNGNDEN